MDFMDRLSVSWNWQIYYEVHIQKLFSRENLTLPQNHNNIFLNWQETQKVYFGISYYYY